MEEYKEEQVPKAVGKKRTQRRRSQLDVLIREAPSITQEKRTHKSEAGTIQMTEREEPQSQGNGDLAEHTLDCLSTDEDEQDLWEALVDFWAGPLQDMEQEADIVTAIDRTQAELARPTTASTESIPRQTTTTDSTNDQTETVSAETTKTDEESHTRSVEGLEECKEEQVPKAVGKKRT